MTKKETRKLNEFENEILEIIDSPDDYTRSDLQGIIMALTMKIYRTGVSRELLDFDTALEMHKNEFATKFR